MFTLQFSKCSNRSQKIFSAIHIFNDSGNFILIRTSVGMIEQNYHAMKSIFVQLYMWQNANRILIVLLKCILKEFFSSHLMHMHTHLINYSIHVQCLYFHKVWYFHFLKEFCYVMKCVKGWLGNENGFLTVFSVNWLK